MGCDIHMVLERKHKIRGKDKWVGLDYNDGSADKRDYAFFAELAGVRGRTPSSVLPRGIPDDASDLSLLKTDDWGVDGHSHTWATLTEFIDTHIRARHDTERAELVATRLEKNTDLYVEEAAKLFGLYLHEHSAPITDYRVVVWFDN